MATQAKPDLDIHIELRVGERLFLYCPKSQRPKGQFPGRPTTRSPEEFAASRAARSGRKLCAQCLTKYNAKQAKTPAAAVNGEP